MSAIDLARFGDDARSNKDILLDLAQLGTDEAAILKYMNSKGYSVSAADLDEMEKLAPAQSQYVRQRTTVQSGVRPLGIAVVVVVVAVWVAVV